MNKLNELIYRNALYAFNEKLKLPQNMENSFIKNGHLNVGYNYSVTFQQRLTTFILKEFISACYLTYYDSSTECS